MKKLLKIVLADDHGVVRQGLRTLLEAELPCEVVAQTADGLSAVELVADLQPDILVVDIMMPGLTGLEVTRRVHEQAPATRVVVLSMYADHAYVREALRAGAMAYVLKESKASEFVHAVRETAAGRRFLSSSLSERTLDPASQSETEPLDLFETLTARERDVLYLAAEGLTISEIAARLVIGTRTVESYRASMLRKLGLRNQTELVRYAIKRGIISMD